MVELDAAMKRLVDSDRGTVSREIFWNKDIYDQEMEQVFNRSWLFVGHVSQIPEPGDFVLGRMGEEAVIVTRDRQSKVHVVLNSCRHRGNRVCRYDEGNTFTHVCSFHGWTYDSSGALAALPYNQNGYDAMDKDQWGLLQARVEIFQGSIWATWDATAPSFHEYLGGADMYLASGLINTDGSDNGSEVLGGVVKWRLGCNWKVPVPDTDTTHGWITHRSLALALGVGATGGPVRPQSNRSESIGQRRPRYTVSFPEGHTMGVTIPEEGDPSWADQGVWADKPIIREYLREKFELRKERLGLNAHLSVGPAIFPNEGWLGRVIRIMHPEGPAMTEIWTYFLVDHDAPIEVKDAIASYYEHWYGPGGMTQQDDMENWYALTKASKGPVARTLDLNYQMRLSEPPLHGPTEFGMPGLFAQNYSDENHRRYYQRWSEVMAAKDWGEMAPTGSAAVK
jgi:phenylpropionate dioxygenase-like ring-hydroxylating dioxygenase large terminal subunit